METPVTFISAADINRQNLGKKRRVHMNEWKDRARKSLRDAGKPYVNRRGEQKRGKGPPKEVSEITVYKVSSSSLQYSTVSGYSQRDVLLQFICLML